MGPYKVGRWQEAVVKYVNRVELPTGNSISLCQRSVHNGVTYVWDGKHEYSPNENEADGQELEVVVELDTS